MSDSAALELRSGTLFVSGVVGFMTVQSLLRQSQKALLDGEEMVIDFTNVTRSDSAGLALLIEWRKIAHKRGKQIIFRNLPDQMTALARAAGLSDLLALATPNNC